MIIYVLNVMITAKWLVMTKLKNVNELKNTKMTKQNLETEYCNERGESSFNTYNDNDYTKWLEKKLIEAQQQVNVNLGSVSKSFEKLIDRLEIASNIKYPSRPYTPEFRKSVAFTWKHKQDELLRQVERLEKEVNVC